MVDKKIILDKIEWMIKMKENHIIDLKIMKEKPSFDLLQTIAQLDQLKSWIEKLED